MAGRDPWEAAYPLASLGLEKHDRRSGAVPAFALAGLLFVALALFVVGYAVLERDGRDVARFQMTGVGTGPPASMTASPGGAP